MDTYSADITNIDIYKKKTDNTEQGIHMHTLQTIVTHTPPPTHIHTGV